MLNINPAITFSAIRNEGGMIIVLVTKPELGDYATRLGNGDYKYGDKTSTLAYLQSKLRLKSEEVEALELALIDLAS